MKTLLKTFMTIGLMGCASDPGYEPRTRPDVSVSESQLRTAQSPEAPRKTVREMQACAERHALRSSADSVAILIDIEATTSTVKIKDSMISGSALEACLARALEHMDLSAAAVNAPHVSPQSRASLGVVQVAAAPIALAPIVLVAAGVTILVGVTIYVATEALTEKERCKKVKAECLAYCSIDTLHQGRPEPEFTRCMRACLEKDNCW